MKHFLLSLLFLFLSVFPAISDEVIPVIPVRQDLTILIGGEEAGYCSYSLYRDPKGYEMTSESYMKLKIMGKPVELTFKERTHFHLNYLPRDYSLDITSPQGKQHIDASFGKDKITSTTASGEREFPLEGTTVLVDNNLLSHWAVLAKTIDYTKDEEVRISSFVPQLQRVVDFSYTVVGPDEEKGGLTKVEANEAGVQIFFWVERKDTLIKRLLIPSQNFEAIEMKERPKKEDIEAPEFVEPMLAALSIPSNVDMGDFNKIKYMKANIDLRFSGEPYLATGYQRFTGEYSNGHITGIVEVKKKSLKATSALRFPLAEPLSVDSVYLLPDHSVGIYSDNEEIAEKAKKIISPTGNMFEASRAICLWVYRNVVYQVTVGTALDAWETRKGDCGPKSLLAISMLRSVGIPARLVGGMLYANGKFAQHNWVEAYLGKKAGWIPLDPTTGEAEKLNAGHITLWLGEGTVSPSGKEGRIEVLEYKTE